MKKTVRLTWAIGLDFSVADGSVWPATGSPFIQGAGRRHKGWHATGAKGMSALPTQLQAPSTLSTANVIGPALQPSARARLSNRLNSRYCCGPKDASLSDARTRLWRRAPTVGMA